MVDIVNDDRWWYRMVVELMERLHPDNFGELPDGAPGREQSDLT